MIDKYGQKFNLGGTSTGLKGSKVKPVYFPFNPNSVNTSKLIKNQSQPSIISQNISNQKSEEILDQETKVEIKENPN